MKNRLSDLAGVVVLAFASLPPSVAVAQSTPSVTLFTNGQSLVRRALTVELPDGRSSQTLALGRFDPTTFAVLDRSVSVEGIRYDAANDENSLLRRNIGREFSFSQGSQPEIRARLMAMDPERWEVISGNENWQPGVVFSRPGRIAWQRELVSAEPIADVTLNSDGARSRLPVMYMAPGGGWSASYRLFLGADARVDGTASISAGVLSLADAEVQLLAGDIGQPIPQGNRAIAMEGMAMAARDQVSGKVASSQSVSEVQLYSLPGRVTFIPGAQLTMPLFETASVTPELRLTVPGTMPYWGGIQEFGDEREVPVGVSYRFARSLGTPFGDLPLPAGGVRVYDADEAGRPQLVGQGGIGHTGPGNELEIHTGTAFDVTAKRTQLSYSTTRDRLSDNRTRTIATISYRVVITNAKDSTVTVEAREDRAGEWSVLESNVEAVRLSSSRVIFPVSVPAKGEATLTYRLRVVW